VDLNERQLRPFRRDLQMIFQDPLSSFNPRYTIANSVALPMLLHGVARDMDDALRRVVSLFDQVGLKAEYGSHFPHELSGGQLQRVAIARVLSVGPQLIVADEAVSKLDVSVRAQILNLIKRTNRTSGVAFLFITHDLAVARFLSHRTAVMYGGRIVEMGATKNIFAHPRHPYTISLMNARRHNAPVPESGNAAPETLFGATCGFAARCTRRQSRCLRERPILAPESAEQAVACFYPNPDEAI
jgi:oligopeptide transport system ATP-binding protein